MFKRLFIWTRLYDWYLVINIILLMIFGLAALYSLQINVLEPNFFFLNRQLTFVGIGLVLFFLISHISFRVWGDYYKMVLVIVCLLLLIVLIAGINIRGTTGWLEFFGQTFQPVELAKIVLVIFLAKFFTARGKEPRLITDVFISGLITGVLILLVMLQPDLGSAMILFLTWLIMVLLLPIKKKTFFIIFLIILVLAASAWLFFLKDYQKERLLTFIQPQRDPLGSGYNVRQSVVAVGSGQLIGRGLAVGSQSQLNFLPEQETDFIFAVIAEELGFVGAGLVLVLFLSLFLRIYKISREIRDNFGNLLAMGIIIYLTIQTFINIGMNMGIAPVTGIPLPLVSYGGSSLLSVLIALGIVLNIHIKSRSSMFASEKEL